LRSLAADNADELGWSPRRRVARVHGEHRGPRRSTSLLVLNQESSSTLVLTSSLDQHGFSIRSVPSGADGVRTFAALVPDVVLIDLDGVAASGLELCRRIRALSDVPIVLISSGDVEMDVIVGLELGADRHVHMPANPVALAARIEALVRRCSQPSVGRYAAVVRVGDVTLDRTRHRVTVRGEPVTLPVKQFGLLEALLERVGHTVARHELIARVWGSDPVGVARALEAHIKRLRAVVETDPRNPQRIVTVRGVGYKYIDPAVPRGPVG
jgi:two-component system response regulator RegX3